MVKRFVTWLIAQFLNHGFAVMTTEAMDDIFRRIEELEMLVAEHGERLDAHAPEKKADEFTDVFREWLNGGDGR